MVMIVPKVWIHKELFLYGSDYVIKIIGDFFNDNRAKIALVNETTKFTEDVLNACRQRI